MIEDEERELVFRIKQVGEEMIDGAPRVGDAAAVHAVARVSRIPRSTGTLLLVNWVMSWGWPSSNTSN